jgi:hypothetical protein
MISFIKELEEYQVANNVFKETMGKNIFRN